MGKDIQDSQVSLLVCKIIYIFYKCTFYSCIRKHIKFFRFMQCNFLLIYVNCRTFFPSKYPIYLFLMTLLLLPFSSIFISGWSLVFWPTNVWRQLHNKRGKWEKEMDDPWPVFFSIFLHVFFHGFVEKEKKGKIGNNQAWN